MDDILAIITIDQKKRKTNIALFQEFKFGCIKCADLCCKLGGPELTEKDIEKIEGAGYCTRDFMDPIIHIENNLKNTIGSLKTKQDGSCIFLQSDSKNNCSRCSIYDFRPSLCRIYPFKIDSLKSNQIAFKYIPCCKGLNNQKGKKIDRNFIVEKFKEARKVFKI